MTRPRERVAVVIPALNEERSLPLVLAEIPRGAADAVFVVDNGSTDGTARVAREGGAAVVSEPRRGYGSACLAGIAAAADSDVIVFLDADHSDYPEEMTLLLEPIRDGRADLVIGSRTLGTREKGALAPQAALGNQITTFLIRLLYRRRYTDLGPFKAIRTESLRALGMRDRGYGWNVEMQIRAIRKGLRVLEVPVSYRKRIGESKISGTLRGTIGAGSKMVFTVFRHALGRG
jgi:glycosyltransferase involved in cell wall biosynthesis